MTAFVQGPEQRIQEQQLAFPSAVDPSRAAVIDEAHRVVVNYEVYYFADDELKQRFLSDATTFTGVLTDPVSLRRFQPDATSARRDFAGRIYFFPDAAAAATFDADPNRFAFPVYKMM